MSSIVGARKGQPTNTVVLTTKNGDSYEQSHVFFENQVGSLTSQAFPAPVGACRTVAGQTSPGPCFMSHGPGPPFSCLKFSSLLAVSHQIPLSTAD